MRKVKSPAGHEFAVYEWFVTVHGWEYYVLDPPLEGNAFGVVMGACQEMGSFSLSEVEPHIIMRASGDELYDLAPPDGWEWCDAVPA